MDRLSATGNDDFLIDERKDIYRSMIRADSIVTKLQSYRPSLNEIFLEVTRPVSGDTE